MDQTSNCNGSTEIAAAEKNVNDVPRNMRPRIQTETAAPGNNSTVSSTTSTCSSVCTSLPDTPLSPTMIGADDLITTSLLNSFMREFCRKRPQQPLKKTSTICSEIRKLSYLLDSKRRSIQIQNVMIVTKHHENILENLFEVVRWLQSADEKFVVYVEDDQPLLAYLKKRSTVEDIALTDLRTWDQNLCRQSYPKIDLVMTLGGDGTVLYTGYLFQRYVPPILSFSLGTIGFLANYKFEEYKEALRSAKRDGVRISLRMRFECTVFHRVHLNRADSNKDLGDCLMHPRIINGTDPATPSTPQSNTSSSLDRPVISQPYDDSFVADDTAPDYDPIYRRSISMTVLNEVVVGRGFGQMTSLELYADNRHITSLQADGVCVSTPTGSTAYSLSAGGTLCHPDIAAILVTPICMFFEFLLLQTLLQSTADLL